MTNFSNWANYIPAGTVARTLVYHKDTPASTTCFFTESKKTVLDFIPGVLTPHPRKVVPSVPGVLDTELVVGVERFELTRPEGKRVTAAPDPPTSAYSRRLC